MAFVPFMAALLPSVMHIYRPDVSDRVPVLPEVIVVPANLPWHPETSAPWGGALIAVCLVLAAVALVAIAGHAFQRRDVPCRDRNAGAEFVIKAESLTITQGCWGGFESYGIWGTIVGSPMHPTPNGRSAGRIQLDWSLCQW